MPKHFNHSRGDFEPKAGQASPSEHRADFWRFCVQAAGNSRVKKSGSLTPHDIDRLLVDQGWRCAVTAIAFVAPKQSGKGVTDPFAPSLDRIHAGGAYEPGNVRVVCAIVNFAMNQWGEAALWRLIDLAREPCRRSA